MDEVVSILRSCLLTSKSGTPIDQINRDYKSIEGEPIPYRKLGFATINEFLRNVPGLLMSNRNGTKYIEAIPNSATAHIATMVSEQRAPKKKRKPMDRYTQSYRRPNVPPRSNYNNQSSSYHSRTGLSSGCSYRFNDKPFYQASNRRNNQTPYQAPRQSVKPNNVPPANKSSFPAINRSNSQPSPSRPVSTPMNRTNSQPSPPKSPAIAKTNQPTSTVPPIINEKVNNPPISPPITLDKSKPIPPLMNPMSFPRQRPSERLIVTQTSKPEETNGSERRVTFATGVQKPTQPITEALIKTDIPSDPREELLQLVRQLNLDLPQYKTTRTTQKKGGPCGMYCQVTVGNKHKVSSYPEDAKTQEEAEKLAAAQAVISIFKSFGPLVELKVTTNKELIKQRIIAIVDLHNGVVEGQLPAYYKEKHHEKLPENWKSIVEEYPMEFRFEQNATGDSSILWRYNPAIHQTKKTFVPPVDSILSILGDPVPSKIIFPTDDVWPVYITNFVSTAEVWVNIIGENYSDRHHAVYLDVSQMYTESMPPTNSVNIGSYYILKDDEGWQRIRVETIDCVNDSAEVFLIDTGHFEKVSCKLLYPMEKKFYDVPPQAVRLCLAELEELADFNTVTNIASDALLYKYCYARVLTRQEDDEEEDLVASAVFYDTTGDDDINVNDLIKREMVSYFKASKFKTSGRVLKVYISQVGINGKIYVQMANEGPQIVANLINRLTTSGLDAQSLKAAAVSEVDMMETYLVQCSDGTWLRAKPIAQLGDSKYNMLLIDIGGNIVVEISKLLKLRQLSTLRRFPKQAFPVYLHNIDCATFDQVKVNRLLDLAPNNQELICKVIVDYPEPPLVEFFKRSPEGDMVSINFTLAIDDIDKTNEDGNNNVTQAKKRLERTNSRSSTASDYLQDQNCLRAPKMPNSGLFEVNVTNLVANPGNFFLQPREDEHALLTMMEALQSYYESYEGPALTLESLKSGKLCAAKYNDQWYRASINAVIDSHMVVVYLCDYGIMTQIPIDELQPLKFWKLPYQAIKAQIYGIEPMNVDWTPITCKRFHDLVAKKGLFADIKCIKEDETSPTKQIVSVELIDTTTETDVKIHDVLVRERRAKLIE